MGVFGLFRGIPILDVERFNISPAVSLFWSRKSAIVFLDIAQAHVCDLWGKVRINLHCTRQREYVLFFPHSFGSCTTVLPCFVWQDMKTVKNGR